MQQAYFSLQRSQLLIESFRDIYDINKQELELLEAQKSIGMATVYDVEQTRSQLFNQLSQLVRYSQNYIQQAAQLAKLLALPPGSIVIPSEPASIYWSWDQTMESTIAKGIDQREEIMASLAAAQSARWSGISMIRSYLPVFQLVGSGNYNFSDGYTNVPVQSDPGESYTWNSAWTTTAGIGFTWSIFDGGINAARAQALYSKSRALKAKAAEETFDVVKQIETSYGQMLTSRIAISSARQAYHSAQKAQKAARARFAVGVGNITSVVQSIQLLSTASQQVAEAMLSYNNAVAELYRYSATWPGIAESEVRQRMKSMRDMRSEATTHFDFE